MKNLVLFLSLSFFFFANVQGQSTEEWLWPPYNDESVEVPEELKNTTKPMVKVSPNPSFNEIMKIWYVNIHQRAKLEVFNLVGERYALTSVGGEKESYGVYKLPISNLSAGVYFVKISTNVFKTVAKVVVE